MTYWLLAGETAAADEEYKEAIKNQVFLSEPLVLIHFAANLLQVGNFISAKWAWS